MPEYIKIKDQKLFVVVDPDGNGSATVTATRIDSSIPDDQLFNWSLASNIPNCTLEARDLDTQAVIGSDTTPMAPTTSFGTANAVSVEAFWTCTGAAIGNYVSWVPT